MTDAETRRAHVAALKTRAAETGKLDDRAAHLLAAIDEDDESERERRIARQRMAVAELRQAIGGEAG